MTFTYSCCYDLHYPSRKATLHCAVRCNVHCIVHCNVHCIVHCNVHCIVHCNVHCNVYCIVHCNVHRIVHRNVHCNVHCIVHCNVHCIVHCSLTQSIRSLIPRCKVTLVNFTVAELFMKVWHRYLSRIIIEMFMNTQHWTVKIHNL